MVSIPHPRGLTAPIPVTTIRSLSALLIHRFPYKGGPDQYQATGVFSALTLNQMAYIAGRNTRVITVPAMVPPISV